MQLHRDREKLAATGGDVWLVGMGTPAHARAFKEETDVEFPILLSRDKAAYRAMDLKRGSTREVFSPSTVLRGPLRALGAGGVGRARGGNLPVRPPQQDWHQFGGAFVIAPGGEVVYEHRSTEPGDTVPTDTLAEALGRASDGAGGPRPGQ